MTLEYQPSDELQGLLADLIDGTASPERRERLRNLLKEDAAAREYYVAFMSIHTALLWKHGGASDEAAQTHFTSALALLSEPTGGSSRRVLSSLRTFVDWRTHQGRFGLFVMAATLLLWAAFFAWISPWWRNGGKPNVVQVDPVHLPLVATVTGLHEPVWAEGANGWEWGARLRAGRTVEFNSGLVELTFVDGARIVLQGPCRFTADSRGAGTLDVGSLVARIEGEQAKGFAIDTPNARVVDMGTEFGVVVDDDGAAEVVVLSGRVDVLLAASGDGQQQRVPLTKGQIAFVAADRGAIVRRERADAQRIGELRRKLTQGFHSVGAAPGVSQFPEQGLQSFAGPFRIGSETKVLIDTTNDVDDWLDVVRNPGYSGSLYLSFEVTVNSENDEKIEGGFFTFLDLVQGESGRLGIGNRWQSPNWSVLDYDARPGVDLHPTTAVDRGTPVRIVARIDFRTGAPDRIAIWLNPKVAHEADQPAPNVLSCETQCDRIQLRSGGNGTVDVTYRNIVFGKSFGSVTAVPESSD